MKIAWRIALVLAAALLGWRALTLGLGAHFAAQAATGDPAKLQAALAWDPSNLSARAQAAMPHNRATTEAAREAWSDLLRSNPASAEALLGSARTSRTTLVKMHWSRPRRPSRHRAPHTSSGQPCTG